MDCSCGFQEGWLTWCSSQYLVMQEKQFVALDRVLITSTDKKVLLRERKRHTARRVAIDRVPPPKV